MGFIINVIDENGDEIPFNRVRAITDPRQICNNGFEEITIQISDDKKQFNDDEIFVIKELLHKAIEYGASYGKMKKYIDLMDKLNEENSINK